MGHSPPGYLSAVKITQAVASDSLLAASCPGASMAVTAVDCPCSAFPRAVLTVAGWTQQGPRCLHCSAATNFASTQSSKLPLVLKFLLKSCQVKGLSSALCNHPAPHLLTLLLNLPWTSFPLARSSIEKMVVVKPSSEPDSTQSCM